MTWSMNWFSIAYWETYLESGQLGQVEILIFLMLFTFVLEDASTVTAAGLALAEKIDPFAGFFAVVIGVFIGDLGLYGMGMAARHIKKLRDFVNRLPTYKLAMLIERNLAVAVFIARLLPGTRLTGYTSFGFLRFNFKVFATSAAFSVLAWTSVLYGGAYGIGQTIRKHFGEHQFIGIVFAILIAIFGMHILTRLLRRHLGLTQSTDNIPQCSENTSPNNQGGHQDE